MYAANLTMIAATTGGHILNSTDATRVCIGVSIDTRTLKRGELFIAIKGENTDGHAFLQNAFASGAAAAIVAENSVRGGNDNLGPLIAVADTHHALIALAKSHRDSVRAKYIGITGSTGKTTVKEMIRHLLTNAAIEVAASTGNLNNLFGLPLSLLRMPRTATVGVFELGISMPGEMSQLAPILIPNVGVITNVSATHTATLGSIDGVRKEKVEMLRHLQVNGVAVVLGDDSNLVAAAREFCPSVVTFSDNEKSDCDYVARDVRLDVSTGGSEFTLSGARVRLPLFGAHNVGNAVCAFAACSALGIKTNPQALESLSMSSAHYRGEVEKVDDITLVVDCYNASPASMLTGLHTFLRYRPTETSGRKIVVLGDMLELGDMTDAEHERIGVELARMLKEQSVKIAGELDLIVTVGTSARIIGEAFTASLNGSLNRRIVIANYVTSEDAGRALMDTITPGTSVYFKASRGIGLERAVTMVKGGAFRAN